MEGPATETIVSSCRINTSWGRLDQQLCGGISCLDVREINGSSHEYQDMSGDIIG